MDASKNSAIVHETANVYGSAKLGDNVKVGAFTEIGTNVVIGENTSIGCSVFIPANVIVEHDVFIGPHVVFTNDKYAPSKGEWKKSPPTVVHKGVSIGANATILPSLDIGEDAVIGAGAVVTKNVLPNTIVVGNPAKEMR